MLDGVGSFEDQARVIGLQASVIGQHPTPLTSPGLPLVEPEDMPREGLERHPLGDLLGGEGRHGLGHRPPGGRIGTLAPGAPVGFVSGRIERAPGGR